MMPVHVVVLYLASIPVVIIALRRLLGAEVLKDVAGAIAAVYVIVTMIVGVFFMATVATPGPQEMVVERVNGVWRVSAIFPEQEWVWSSDPRITNTFQNPDRRLVSYATHAIAAAMRIEPITPNPKVRETQYAITVEVGGTPEAMLDFVRSVDQTVGGVPQIGIYGGDVREYDWLKYYLYEFNERRGREIGSLYNPINKDQQRQFSRFAADFLESSFAPAQVRFKEARFWLKGPE